MTHYLLGTKLVFICLLFGFGCGDEPPYDLAPTDGAHAAAWARSSGLVSDDANHESIVGGAHASDDERNMPEYEDNASDEHGDALSDAPSHTEIESGDDIREIVEPARTD